MNDHAPLTDSIGNAQDVMIAGRDYNPETDEAFLFSTWRNGAYYGGDRALPAQEFFSEQTGRIRDILKTAQIRVACIKDAPEIVLGYAVFTGDFHLEWIYVKLQFRGKGIGRFLTPQLRTVTPNLTKIGAAIVRKKNLTIKGESL